ncbi:hypothetical protein [Priestia flexa]|uniref:hypothetical protein n=1 Tax=Priestia flexa TaxID=86664 RepID=UPI001F254239|nr:hypothetical protein [Priestia flexa]
MFGNAISEEQRQNSLFQSLGIAGAGALSTRYAANMGQAVVTKGTEKLTQMRNTLRTSTVANVTKQAYQSVKTAPASWTQSLHKTYTSILDSTMPRLMPERAPAGPALAQQTVRETLQNVKQQAMQMITPIYNPKVKRYQDPETGRFVTNPNVERVEKPVGVEKKGKEVERVRNVESVQGVSRGTGENNIQGARYGERKISDETYGKLRRASPSSKIQREVNKNIDDIIGTEDFALPGKIIDKKLHADHIVSLEKIARMEGFETLTYNQQKEIANFVENFIVLSEAANTSKGSKSFADWYIYKKENIPVNPVFREKMILKEKELEIEIQKIIDEFNRINKKE